MANVTQLLDPDVFRFELYNLNYFKDCDTGIRGHYTFWYHKPTGKFVFCKHGDFHNLVSFRPVYEPPRVIPPADMELLQEMLSKFIRHTYFYNGDNPHCAMGPYLLDDLEAACDKRDGWGTEWFKHAHDEYLDHIMKINTVFPCDYPDAEYKQDENYWNHIKENDTLAIKMLTTA